MKNNIQSLENKFLASTIDVDKLYTKGYKLEADNITKIQKIFEENATSDPESIKKNIEKNIVKNSFLEILILRFFRIIKRLLVNDKSDFDEFTKNSIEILIEDLSKLSLEDKEKFFEAIKKTCEENPKILKRIAKITEELKYIDGNIKITNLQFYIFAKYKIYMPIKYNDEFVLVNVAKEIRENIGKRQGYEDSEKYVNYRGEKIFLNNAIMKDLEDAARQTVVFKGEIYGDHKLNSEYKHVEKGDNELYSQLLVDKISKRDVKIEQVKTLLMFLNQKLKIYVADNIELKIMGDKDITMHIKDFLPETLEVKIDENNDLNVIYDANKSLYFLDNKSRLITDEVFNNQKIKVNAVFNLATDSIKINYRLI